MPLKDQRLEVLITAKRFPPEVPATAVLGRELAEVLTRQGCRVTVAAGYPHHPYGRLFPGFVRKWSSVEEQDGYRLVRSWHLIHRSPATWVRSLVMASHCASYLLSSLRAPRPRVVISFDGYPLLGPLTSILIARMFGAKAITVIYDLYPDIAVELGKLRNPKFIALARALENLIYRLSDRIVVLSEGFRNTLIREKAVEAHKVAVIPVWLDERAIAPGSRDNPWRREAGIPPEKFVVLYAGTIGLVSGAEVILEAAKRLAGRADIVFLLVGDGYGKELVQARAQELGLENIKFLPFQPRRYLADLQATADVSLVTLAPGRGRTSVPSKVLGYMAAARPVIASVDPESGTAAMIRQAACGLVTPPGDGEALAQAISYYLEDPERRTQAGESGLKYFLKNYKKAAVVQQFKFLIDGLFGE